MKVILRQNVETLGEIGSIVNVKAGYARNYLIPRSLAYLASPAAIKALEVEKRQYESRMNKMKSGAEQVASQLGELQISIPMQVGEEGRLFGSVTAQMIAQELDLRGFSIDRRSILIEEPIKSLGIFDVRIKLHSEVVADMKIWVIAQE